MELKLHKLPSDAKKARLGTGPSEEKRGWEPRLKVWVAQPYVTGLCPQVARMHISMPFR